MTEKKTGFEWCLIEKIRLLHLSQWPTNEPFFAESYHSEKITYADFFERIKQCETKQNSTPRKTDMFLEYRMYGMVPYNLSPIQQGIQYGHAVIEYQQMVKGLPPSEVLYNKWAQNDKTFIILDGGTTNNSEQNYGTLQKNRDLLAQNEILFSEFKEPDLNDALTAICFLVDERCWNKILYCDFIIDTTVSEEINIKQYNEWLIKIGGAKNLFLREFLPKFKLA
jgi:hypothetical protein